MREHRGVLKSLGKPEPKGPTQVITPGLHVWGSALNRRLLVLVLVSQMAQPAWRLHSRAPLPQGGPWAWSREWRQRDPVRNHYSAQEG